MLTPNGVASPMPVKTVTIRLDDVGYEGWYADLRLNVRASIYDDLLNQDRELFWKAFQRVVVAWNFLDEDGVPLPLPKDGLGPKDLPYDVLNPLVMRYFEAQAQSAAIPKDSADSSSITSPTNGVAPSGAPA